MPENDENKQSPVEETPAEQPQDQKAAEPKKKKKTAELEQRIAELEAANEALAKEAADSRDSFLRLSAEFDNYKKRTAKERDGIYAESVASAVSQLLPVLDNLERAAAAEGYPEALRKGVEMTLRQMIGALGKLNVAEIEVKPGDSLDPNIHNAMMQVEDDALPPNCVAEVLMKGYRIGDRVIRYSMVKSAN
ncbi:MAG: nucleotide exchange factor GrpE [Clostridia bacterium]|nr:nucleotide exchange factor GrpE [Clostridia bacterium]